MTPIQELFNELEKMYPETFVKDSKKQQDFVKMWMLIEKNFIIKTFSTAWNKTQTFNLFYNENTRRIF
jgi:hypothetical protein